MNDSDKILEENKVEAMGMEMVPLTIARQALELKEAEVRLDKLEDKLKDQQDKINDAMIKVHSLLNSDPENNQ